MEPKTGPVIRCEKPVVRRVLGLKAEEHMTLTLLKGHSIKLTANDYHYTNGAVQLSTLIREVYIYSKQ